MTRTIFSKKFRREELNRWFPDRVSLPIVLSRRSPKTRMAVSAPLGRFVPSLRAEWHPCTSGTVKRGGGAFVRRCEG